MEMKKRALTMLLTSALLTAPLTACNTVGNDDTITTTENADETTTEPVEETTLNEEETTLNEEETTTENVEDSNSQQATVVVIGNLSPTHKKFDYIITIIMPLSFCCSMLIIGFFGKSDLETRFHLDGALNAAFQPWSLITYCVMALTAFLASFKTIRIAKRIKSN
ncbi:MAG: hypothetical protein IJX07_05675 [Bacillales bacterium]|nr:hypothetical protein [Bacillales bacterium]